MPRPRLSGVGVGAGVWGTATAETKPSRNVIKKIFRTMTRSIADLLDWILIGTTSNRLLTRSFGNVTRKQSADYTGYADYKSKPVLLINQNLRNPRNLRIVSARGSSRVSFRRSSIPVKLIQTGPTWLNSGAFHVTENFFIGVRSIRHGAGRLCHFGAG